MKQPTLQSLLMLSQSLLSMADIVAASADAPSQSKLIVDGGGARGGGILQLQRRSSKAAGSREQELGSEEHRLDDVLQD